jgi:toxin-antitoxin system PIN domain toxin
VTFLLDVNVLIALIDPTHISHDAAHDWFDAEGHDRWATCPFVENGVMRIVANPRYQNTPGSPAVVASVLRDFKKQLGHVFWPDDISLLTAAHIDPDHLLSCGQITDTYLLALAVAHGGQLASLDHRLSVSAVHGGHAALRLIR